MNIGLAMLDDPMPLVGGAVPPRRCSDRSVLRGPLCPPLRGPQTGGARHVAQPQLVQRCRRQEVGIIPFHDGAESGARPGAGAGATHFGVRQVVARHALVHSGGTIFVEVDDLQLVHVNGCSVVVLGWVPAEEQTIGQHLEHLHGGRRVGRARLREGDDLAGRDGPPGQGSTEYGQAVPGARVQVAHCILRICCGEPVPLSHLARLAHRYPLDDEINHFGVRLFVNDGGSPADGDGAFGGGLDLSKMNSTIGIR